MDSIPKLSKLLEATQQRLRDSELRIESLGEELTASEKRARTAIERCRQAELETKRYAKNQGSLEQAYNALMKEHIEVKKRVQTYEKNAAAEVEAMRHKLKIQADAKKTLGMGMLP